MHHKFVAAIAVSMLVALVARAPFAFSDPSVDQPSAEQRQNMLEIRRLMVEEGLSREEAMARFAADAEAEADVNQGDAGMQAGRPGEAYAGCDTVIAKAPQIAGPRKRIEQAATQVDALTEREFASFSVDELARSLASDEIDACWFRLDGVWREDRPVALDTNFIPEGWSSTRPELVSLANGTYTRPLHIYIEPSPEPETFLRVRPVYGDSEPILYTSTDGVSLEQLLQDRGRRKAYRAPKPGPAPGLAQLMVVDVTRTGYLRLRIGATNFYRPAPGTVSRVSADDPFMIGYTMENLRANRTGYDITTQNPNRLLQNPKSEVFDFAMDRGAVIDQRRVIPLGLKLIKEETQGNVFYSQNLSSEREYQRMTRSNFGNSTHIGLSGSASAGGETGNKRTAGASLSMEAGLGWGSQSAREQFNALRRSGSVAEEVGYMRFKKLALVLDPTYARLTDRFIDAVADLQRYHGFREFFNKFGTHYAYAITYGAAGEVRQKITTRGFERIRARSSSSQSNSRASFVFGNTSSYSSSEGKTGSSFKETNEYGERTFDAVGGNGSWDQNGFSAGDAQYPILADMRPLSELLNPINFPRQPEIYIDLRQRLAFEIAEYTAAQADLSDEPLVADLSAEPGPPRNMAITTWLGSPERITVSIAGHNVRRGFTRICLVNNTKGHRMLIHHVPRINPLQSDGSGRQSCANFSSSLTLNFTAQAGHRSAAITNATGIRLAPYDGMLLNFEWHK